MEQRYQAVMEVLGAHIPVTEVAERYGVSRQAVHRWIRHYRSGGIGALLDQPTTPRSSPLRLDPRVEAAICEMRRNHRRWGPRTLALLARTRRHRPGAGPIDDLSGAGAQPPDRAGPPQAQEGQLRALGARRLHGAVAARLHLGGLPQVAAATQGGHRHRRPFALLRAGQGGAPGHARARSAWPSPRRSAPMASPTRCSATTAPSSPVD